MGSKKLTKSTGRKATIYRSATCLNCGHPLDLSDIYCSYCSQLNSTKKPTLKDFFDELFSNIISYDSRFRKTLSVLVFRPGKITKEYVAGKRMTYANPFRFYLSISFLFFIIWGAIYNFNDVNFNDSDDLKELNNDGFVISKDGVKIEGDAALDSVFSNENSQSLALDSLIARSILKDSIKSYKDLYYSEEQLDTLNIFYGLDKRFTLYKRFHTDTKIRKPKEGLDSLNHNVTRYHKWIYKKAVDTNTIGDNLGEMIAFFFNQLPFVIFFFLPVFALFVKLLYIRRKFTYTDHLIFLFHTQTMFFVVYGVGIIIDEIFDINYATLILTFLFLFYLYKALRTFYNQRRLKNIVKFFILNSIFFILAFIGAIFAFAISFATY
jgi:hypothetical protein